MTGAPLRIDGIVLSLVDVGERDRIVRLLSPDHGRVSVMARGARGTSKRFGGALDVGNRVEAQARKGRGELWTLESAVALGSRLRIRESLARMAYATYGCELCGKLGREEHPEPRLFGLLETFLTLLDGLEGDPGPALRLAMESKALTYAGWTPVLDRCSRCGESLGGAGEPLFFSTETGGALHARCLAGLPVGEGTLERVDVDFVAFLESLRRRRLIEIIDERAPDGPLLVLARFAEHHVGSGLRSLDWLAGLERR